MAAGFGASQEPFDHLLKVFIVTYQLVKSTRFQLQDFELVFLHGRFCFLETLA